MRDVSDLPTPAHPRDRNTSSAFGRSRLLLLAPTVAVALFLAASILPTIFPAWADLSAVFLDRQDRPLLLCDLAVLVACSIGLHGRSATPQLPAWTAWAMAAGVVCFCVVGHRWILAAYDMSRDEQMASFDARIFGHGLLVQPLPPFWRAHADALNTLFMLPVLHPVAWVSAYLPINAVLRALVGLVADPVLTGPMMAGLGLVFLWNCARRLWPEEREAAVVAVLLYAGSGQVLFAGMSSYAMPAHLTLDLLWLWLFLAHRRGTDIGALLVGLVATGLHQPLFHPLFALPFLIGLVRDRAWDRIALYGPGYAMISAFWLAWPMLMRSLMVGAASETQATGTGYMTRLVETLVRGDPTRWAHMAENLLRFAAWQPVLLVPLMVAGIVLAWRERPMPALAASVILPVVVMAIILPYQGHGFGYRYLHGVIGPAILLAVAGWRHLSRRDGRFRSLFMRSTIAGVASVLPLQAAMAHGFYAPWARIDAQIRASGADYAIIGRGDAPFARDLVINRPDLSNRPIRLLGESVDDALVGAICRPGVRIAMATNALFAPIDAYLATASSGAADARYASLSATLETAGCTVERIGAL